MRNKLIAASVLMAASLAAQYVPPGGGGSSALPTGSGNCVVASPANGSSATVACRSLVAADEVAAGASGAVQVVEMYGTHGIPAAKVMGLSAVAAINNSSTVESLIGLYAVCVGT